MGEVKPVEMSGNPISAISKVSSWLRDTFRDGLHRNHGVQAANKGEPQPKSPIIWISSYCKEFLSAIPLALIDLSTVTQATDCRYGGKCKLVVIKSRLVFVE
jgi:hypothetical protein